MFFFSPKKRVDTKKKKFKLMFAWAYLAQIQKTNFKKQQTKQKQKFNFHKLAKAYHSEIWL